MNKLRYLLVFIFSLLAVQSCFKDDESVAPYPGEIITIPDSIQKYQLYFDLESGSIPGKQPVTEWELGFESKAEGWHIITNSGASWFLYNSGLTTEPVPGMPERLSGLYDIQHAWPDSTAAGDWVFFGQDTPQYTKNIYLLGRYSGGVFDDLKQIRFLGVTDSSYSFYYNDPDNGIDDTVVITKDPSRNFVYFSFRLKEQVNPEPDKADYDLVFGSYYDMATNFGITQPYLVGGALINIWQTSALLDSTSEYSKITLETASTLDFSQQRDIPGYRWKTVTVDVSGGGAATYEVKTHYNYLIRTAQGNFFKLRFLSYSLDGRSGYPQFEYQLLE